MRYSFTSLLYVLLSQLTLHYHENCIFPNGAILKHKQVHVVCMRRKMLYTIFKYLFFHSRDIQVFKLCKLAKW